MKNKNIENKNSGNWDWLFSDKEFQDGETFDIHYLLNVYTGDIKKVIQKRLEIKKDNKETIVMD